MNRYEIEQALQLYFDASYEGNPEKMRAAFHPSAHIYGHDTDGTLIDWSVDDFCALIAEGVSPKNAGQAREDAIVSIDFTGADTAVSRVKLRVGPTKYTDIISLIRLNGRWCIIAKLLSGVRD